MKALGLDVPQHLPKKEKETFVNIYTQALQTTHPELHTAHQQSHGSADDTKASYGAPASAAQQ